MDDTELRLITWRNGFTQAERLAASVLKLAGYEEIDPQAPLGGGDGGKDIICSKGGKTWVGAVYFPPTLSSFTVIKKKYKGDLEKAPEKHRGIAFVTNQHLTLKQRQSLGNLATEKGRSADIFNLERVKALLDAPNGYGVRLQFLRIPMTTEEQLAWFSDSGNKVEHALEINTRELMAIKSMIQQLSVDSTEIKRTMQLLDSFQPLTPDLLSTANFIASERFEAVSAGLKVHHILLFHRLTAFDLPTQDIGTLRGASVTIGAAREPEHLSITPPPASEVKGKLVELCEEWRISFGRLKGKRKEEKLRAIAEFHAKILFIHPFLDGNGRAARAILMQQCLDLFGRANMSLLERGREYFSALQTADNGNLEPLTKLLRPIVDG